jgi:hypothetical protein
VRMKQAKKNRQEQEQEALRGPSGRPVDDHPLNTGPTPHCVAR